MITAADAPLTGDIVDVPVVARKVDSCCTCVVFTLPPEAVCEPFWIACKDTNDFAEVLVESVQLELYDEPFLDIATVASPKSI